MKITKSLLILALLLVTSFNISAQDIDAPAVENEKLFTDKDNDFLQLWYYDQVLKMDMNEDGRYDYLGLLTYYTYKMGRLGLAKYEYTDSEIKTRFDALVVKMDTDMKDFLSTKNYAIHAESFKTIEEMVYKKKNWRK